MPIREESFRIGCGRYLQGKGALSKCGEEVLRLGSAPLVIGGETALKIAGERIREDLRNACKTYEITVHNGTCNDGRAQELAALAKERGYDVIVGVGGGVIMDFSKLCGHFSGLPVINIPTSSATCAAYTPLSVRYTPEGRTVGTMHFDREVNAVIADTEILGAQPPRLLLAGVFDALAKFVEIKQRFDENAEEYPMGLDYAYTMAKRSFALLTQKTGPCLKAMKAGKITPDVENVIFTAIAATGVISGIARGSNQCALAHKFYETTRKLFPETAKPYLHGEIVGVGLLLQNHFNGEAENNGELQALMKEYGLPCRIAHVGVDGKDETFEAYYTAICNSSAIHKDDPEECAKFRESLRYLWAL